MMLYDMTSYDIISDSPEMEWRLLGHHDARNQGFREGSLTVKQLPCVGANKIRKQMDPANHSFRNPPYTRPQNQNVVDSL